MKYAVNIADLTKYTRGNNLMSPVMLLLQPVLTRDQVECERGRIDGVAILVREGTLPERWAAIIKILREGVGNLEPIPKHDLRIYESKTGKGGWKRT